MKQVILTQHSGALVLLKFCVCIELCNNVKCDIVYPFNSENRGINDLYLICLKSTYWKVKYQVTPGIL